MGMAWLSGSPGLSFSGPVAGAEFSSFILYLGGEPGTFHFSSQKWTGRQLLSLLAPDAAYDPPGYGGGCLDMHTLRPGRARFQFW